MSWGKATYSDGTAVPLVSERCKSTPHGVGNAHKCREHDRHPSLHRCICGMRWTHAGTVIK